MPAFRLLNQFPVYLGNNGRPASGGKLRFYDSGSTTPKSVYADPALTVDNGFEVAIGTDGRTVLDVWGSGSYRVRLYDQDDTLIDEADDVEVPGGSGTAIPTLVDGYFLTNNGELLLWAPLLQVPDPSGQTGKVLGTDGTNLNWQAPPVAPEAPTLDTTVGGGGVILGNGVSTSKVMVQFGAESAPASGVYSSTRDVTFETAYTAAPVVVAMPTSSSQPGGPVVTEVASVTTTGFQVKFDIAEGHESGANVVNPIPFNWVAIGAKTVA